MSNKQSQGNHGQPGSQHNSGVKPGGEQERQREQQHGHPGSAERPGTPADIAKEKHTK